MCARIGSEEDAVEVESEVIAVYMSVAKYSCCQGREWSSIHAANLADGAAQLFMSKSNVHNHHM